MISRLPPTHTFHATGLRAACKRPQLYKVAYPDLPEPPSSLAAVCGTVGHLVLGSIHQGLMSDNLSAKDYADAISEHIVSKFDELLDPDTGTDFGDGTGRVSWLMEEESEIRAHLESETPDMGQMIVNYCRWWRQNIGGLTDGILGVEIPYRMELQGKGHPYIVEGLVDLVVMIPEFSKDRPCLFDWKFGSMARNGLSQGMLDMDYQLATYSLAAWKGALPGVPPQIPAMSGLFLMEDVVPYSRRTPLNVPRFPTDARRRWLTYWQSQGKTAFQPGDLRGPLLHDTTFTEASLRQHETEMKATMAATRTGGALVRVRGDNCLWCFYKDLCVSEWKRDPSTKDEVTNVEGQDDA